MLKISLINQIKQISTKLLSVNILVFALSAISLLGYLLVVNNTNTLGYEIAEMKLAIRQLDKDYGDLQNKAIELSAMQRIEQISNQELHMVNSGRVEYVDSSIQTVAYQK